ncbi:hypothetical protein ACVBEF_05840 [Glaciimonas sp. GG7]
MKRTLSLGATSLTGKSANALAEEMFGHSAFPLQLRITNKTPRTLVLPDVRLELKPNFAGPDNIAEVTFKNHGLFTRFVSDIDALAELNQWADAINVTDVENGEEAATKRLAPGAKNQKPPKPDAPETDVATTPKK